MSRRDSDRVSFNLHMIRQYIGELAAYKEGGGTFTSDEVDSIQSLTDKMEFLSESTTEPERQGETGGGPANP